MLPSAHPHEGVGSPQNSDLILIDSIGQDRSQTVNSRPLLFSLVTIITRHACALPVLEGSRTGTPIPCGNAGLGGGVAELAGNHGGALADPVAQLADPIAPVARLEAGDADGAGHAAAPAEDAGSDAGDALGVLLVVDRIAALQAECELLHELRHGGDGAQRSL